MPGLKRSQLQDSGDSNEAPLSLVAINIPDPFVQNLFVLCHGEEVSKWADTDEAEAESGARPWDPPLTARGKQQAWRVGQKIKLEGWNVTRVVVSPFLRCVQTAAEVMAGLSSTGRPSSAHIMGGQDLPNAASTIKAAIECGLAENLMNKPGMVPHPSGVEDNSERFQSWTLDLAELYAMLPVESYDPSFQPIIEKLPQSRESPESSQYRYTSTLKKITNTYMHENILCITHGEGVRQSVSMMWPPTEVNMVTHCAYVHGQRPVFEEDDVDWELLTELGSSSGIFSRPYI